MKLLVCSSRRGKLGWQFGNTYTQKTHQVHLHSWFNPICDAAKYQYHYTSCCLPRKDETYCPNSKVKQDQAASPEDIRVETKILETLDTPLPLKRDKRDKYKKKILKTAMKNFMMYLRRLHHLHHLQCPLPGQH